MTFDEWIKSGDRQGLNLTAWQRDELRSAYEAGRWVGLNADREKCKPFDAQGEIAELRRELKEFTERVSALESFLNARRVPYDYTVRPPYEVKVGDQPAPKMKTKDEWLKLVKQVKYNGEKALESSLDIYGEDFRRRYEQLVSDGMDEIDAFSLALDERHGRKPKPNNFQGY